MNALKHKIKISILWMIFAVSASAAMITWFIEPGIMEQIIQKGELAGEKLNIMTLVFFSFWWLIPLSMAFLTQVLKYSPNRRANLIVGLIFTLLTVYYLINLIISGWFLIPNLLILVFELIVTILIIKYTLELPEETT
jgi:hypothetical protein